MTDRDRVRQAQRLRDRAACLLYEAVRCSDPARRDGLLREALAQLDEARLLLDRQDEAEGFGSGQPKTRMH